MIHPEKVFLILVAAGAIAGSTPVRGSTSVLAGMFDGADPVISPEPRSNCPEGPMPYRESQFTVSAGGAYVAYSGLPSWANAPALSISIYRDTFQPASPLANRVGFWRDESTVKAALEARLEAGQTYTLVVRQICEAREGAWAVALVGPGTAQSIDAVVVPAYTNGRFSDSDPEGPVPNGCGWDPEDRVRYKVIGPMQVSQSGTHYFQSPAYTDPVEALCLGVYSAPPSASFPDSNLVQRMFLAGQFDLEAARDYWLVVSSSQPMSAREYSFVLAPPAPFRINKGLADSWYNPDMPGQGIFLDVFEVRNSLFLGWFTYALEGEPTDQERHRWLTAFGPFESTRSSLDLQWTAADHPRPEGQPPTPHVDGRLDLEFHDCRSGLIRYSWGATDSGTALVEGEMPIRRIADDSVALCESLYAGPGTPGRL
jgi:hypothetical protein